MRTLLGILLLSVPWATGIADYLGGPLAGPFLSTPQIEDWRRPLRFVSQKAQVRSAIFTVADPVETHLGRAFDIQVSSLIRGFQVNGYVLDRFALPWHPPQGSAEERGKRLAQQGTDEFKRAQRATPGILVFRKDEWRARGKGNLGSGTARTRVNDDYFVVFLVGESPTFGIQPRAFAKAAHCSLFLGGVERTPVADKGETECNKQDAKAAGPEETRLKVIGPSFSGSINSLAAQISELIDPDSQTRVGFDIVSPSATVVSNDYFLAAYFDPVQPLKGPRGKSAATNVPPVTYATLARDLGQQFEELCAYDKRRRNGGPSPGPREERIVILAEESTFGQGVDFLRNHKVVQLTDDQCKQQEWSKFAARITVTSFPQNVAAIRAEHFLIDREKRRALEKLLPAQSPLLELDLSGIEQNIDRPPAYHRRLSSRSDELMLYGAFDALRYYVKPSMVVIIATDVRDRLFLLNEIRKSLPNTLPVMLELDYLVAHPDYRKIARGSLVIPVSVSLVCVGKEGLPRITPCFKEPKPGKPRNFFAFPSGYAANVFRAAFNVLGNCRPEKLLVPGGTQSDTYYSGELAASCVGDRPKTMVATLAGFQSADLDAGHVVQRLVAANERLLLPEPVYTLILLTGLFLLSMAGWLHRHNVTHLVMLSPLRYSNPFKGIKEKGHFGGGTHDSDRAPRKVPIAWLNTSITLPSVPAVAQTVVAVAGSTLTLVAVARFNDQFDRLPKQLLAHGRDEWILICLFLAYLAVAAFAVWRLYLWRCLICKPDAHSDRNGETAASDTDAVAEEQGCSKGTDVWERIHRGNSLPSKLLLVPLAVLAIISLGWLHGAPDGVDRVWLAMGMNLLLLAFGIAFLMEFHSSARRWQNLAQWLSPIIDIVNADRNTKVKSENKDRAWPTPELLHECPQSPFSLHLRPQDLCILHRYSHKEWMDYARTLRDTGNREPIDDKVFGGWELRLIAEMRYAAVAVRSLAWCAILAPVFVLLGMSIYPPFDEKLLTTASVALIAAGFALLMFNVIRLEGQPLLSRMFTQHRDQLSFGSILGALWGKLIAAALILVPVLFPDVLKWVQGILQSINSLQ